MVIGYKSTGLLIVAGFVLLYLVKKNVTDTAKSVGKALDVTSKDNIAAQLSDKTTAALTGGKDKSLGGFWYRNCKEKDFEPWYCPNV